VYHAAVAARGCREAEFHRIGLSAQLVSGEDVGLGDAGRRVAAMLNPKQRVHRAISGDLARAPCIRAHVMGIAPRGAQGRGIALPDLRRGLRIEVGTGLFAMSRALRRIPLGNTFVISSGGTVLLSRPQRARPARPGYYPQDYGIVQDYSPAADAPPRRRESRTIKLRIDIG
jgi:hypothetical protein